MVEKTHYTRKQHYIPQFHFRNFSSMEKGIYRYDLKHPDKDSIVVSIDSECCKKDLYEIYGENNTIISQNYIEDIFSKYESNISNAINHIKQKAMEASNLENSLFLTSEEKTTLLIYLTLEMLRSPEIIKIGKEQFLKATEKTIEEYEANNYALLSMFPLPDVNIKENIVFFKLVEWFADKTFRVGVTDKNNIFLGDTPYCFEAESKEPDIAAFPLSSNIVLFVYPKKKTKIECRNRLFVMDEELIRIVQSSIVKVSNNWIYSYKPINKDEKEIIKDAIKVG